MDSIKTENILMLLDHALEMGWPMLFVREQINLYNDGIRDVRIHDDVLAFLSR